MAPWRDLPVGPYTLRAVSVGIKGDPTLEEAGAALAWIHDFEKKCPFWLGRIWNDARERWGEKAYQIVPLGGFDRRTLDNYARVERKIKPDRRRKDLSFAHHDAVAGLEPLEQDQVLAQAASDDMTVTDIRQAVRERKRQVVATGETPIAGRYRVVLVVPDWRDDELEAVAHWPVPERSRAQSVLFLSHFEKQRRGAFELLDAWGFEHKAAILLNRGPGQGPQPYVDETHQTVLLATRGRPLTPDRLTPLKRSIQSAQHHGEVPASMIKPVVEDLYDGPYCLFGAGGAIAEWEASSKRALRLA